MIRKTQKCSVFFFYRRILRKIIYIFWFPCFTRFILCFSLARSMLRCYRGDIFTSFSHRLLIQHLSSFLFFFLENQNFIHFFFLSILSRHHRFQLAVVIQFARNSKQKKKLFNKHENDDKMKAQNRKKEKKTTWNEIKIIALTIWRETLRHFEHLFGLLMTLLKWVAIIKKSTNDSE